MIMHKISTNGENPLSLILESFHLLTVKYLYLVHIIIVGVISRKNRQNMRLQNTDLNSMSNKWTHTLNMVSVSLKNQLLNGGV